MNQFAVYPHLKYGKILVEGYIRRLTKQSSLKSIHYVHMVLNLCTKYYLDDEDGFVQLAYQIFIGLKRKNISHLSKKSIKRIIRKYLKMKNKANASFYFKELVRLKYIAPVHDKNGLYIVTLTKKMLFSRSMNDGDDDTLCNAR